jgi:hypothetical protein
MDCPICLEKKSTGFKCHTCRASVCQDCYEDLIQHHILEGHIYYIEGDEVKLVLSCPCCRSMNWREMYDICLSYMLDISEVGEWQHQIPATRYLMRNIDERLGHEFEVDPFDEDESRRDRRHIGSLFESRLRNEGDRRPFKRNMTIRLKKHFQAIHPGENVEIVLIDPESDTDEN